MKYFKGFDKDLKCRDFQFEIGGKYEEEKADLCNSGFHACENPLDVFDYYAPSDSRFCEVELDGLSVETSNGSKVCGKKIKIGLEIGLRGLIEAGVKFILEKVDWDNKKESNTGYQSAATNTGYQSAATNTGDQSAAKVEGANSVAIATGYKGKAAAPIGSAITVVERDDDYNLISIKSAIVDGEILKPDTYYMLKNGEFVEGDGFID